MTETQEVMRMKCLIPLFLIILIAGCLPTEQPLTPPVSQPQTPEPQAPAENPQPAEIPSEAETPVIEQPRPVVSDNKIVYINRYSFSDDNFTIEQGTKITWVSNDTRMHLIVIKTPVYVKGERLEESGANWSYKFTRASTWEYVDSVFGIRGVINVQ